MNEEILKGKEGRPGFSRNKRTGNHLFWDSGGKTETRLISDYVGQVVL